ncbi:ADP-ribose glycohydrolase OARD1 isoform X1 [Archocentrus centrarchus]|uniref:ADP-ribose glycohydrolase OARD1 isoform X1 n=2 Tax=Archocentrus centrarchus TaxID=63155 RepID=UPI0011EA43B9|nr:ADP-ribose glycohydrolase OARD1 isoform X1 [Archocentrus centrarchus]
MPIIPRCFSVCSRFFTANQVALQVFYSRSSMSFEAETSSSTDTVKPAEDKWRLSYVTGNLFSCPKDESLAHCISEDCRMGAGIAVRFKQEFQGVTELKEQKKLTGQCAVLKRRGRFVYYLITKKKASQKPTYDSLRQSLEDMKSHCLKNQVTRISMPRIGCGLDRLEWARVSEILEQVFDHTNISITVYSLPEKAETTVMKENRRT